MFFHEFYSQHPKNSALVAVSTLWRVPPTLNTMFVWRLHGLSGCPAVPCSLCPQMASPTVFATQSTVNTPRAVGGTPYLWKAAPVSMRAGRTNSISFNDRTHRLVPCTRYHVLPCCRYSRYAVFLNCFLNSMRCLWGLPLSGVPVHACGRSGTCLSYL